MPKVFLNSSLQNIPTTSLQVALEYILQQLEDQLNSTENNDIGNLHGNISDTQHGIRLGGNLHAIATDTIAGFISAADKTKIDHYQGDTSAAGPATTTQFPHDGDWGYHTDTSGSTYKLAKNKGGTIYTTLLT